MQILCPPDERELARLVAARRELLGLAQNLTELETGMHEALERVPSAWRESARNLVHYIALRQHDLRELQIELAGLGLSSLGRSESCVQSSLRQVLQRLDEALVLRGAPGLAPTEPAAVVPDEAGAREAAESLLHQHTREILGARPADRHVYIMVTAPPAAEADRAWMERLLSAGMNVLRINCAHEGPAEWQRLLDALTEAKQGTGHECRVLMDLAGPKIRTGSIGGGRHIATWKPEKDDLGAVQTPGRVVIRRASAPERDPSQAELVLDDAAFAMLRPGDELGFRDAREKRCRLAVREIGPDTLVCSSKRRSYVLEQAAAHVTRDGKRIAKLKLQVQGGESGFIDVRVGDELILSAQPGSSRPPKRAATGRVQKRGVVCCTLPAALALLDVGQRVLFDDGKIEAVVKKAKKRQNAYLLSVQRTHKSTSKLRAEKGINLPDTTTKIPALTDEDRRALSFVVAHADAVSLSFVKSPDDVRTLHAELDRLGRPDIGVVLKIETRAGFENLPRLLLESLQRPPLAVMIARGDLAVEVGFERLAELQEEILWLCEACHVPAIWATQVLDTLARTGSPSRAEVTDAAASVAAECVMLNKGPFVDQAVRALSDILRRMEKHRYKKRSLFRRLRVSTFGEHGA
jgi:pyruvate kinase